MKRLLVGVAVAVLFGAGAARAGQIEGSFTISGDLSFLTGYDNNTYVSNATITDATANFNASTGNNALPDGLGITVSFVNNDAQSIPGFLTWTNGVYSFVYDIVQWTEAYNQTTGELDLDTSGTLSVSEDGTLIDSQGATSKFIAIINDYTTPTVASGSGTFDTPEPATLALLGSALVGLGLIRRRRG